MCEILFLIFGLTSISDPKGKRDEPTWETIKLPHTQGAVFYNLSGYNELLIFFNSLKIRRVWNSRQADNLCDTTQNKH